MLVDIYRKDDVICFLYGLDTKMKYISETQSHILPNPSQASNQTSPR